MLSCYDCIHRRSIPGNTHSRCKHPSLEVLEPFGDLLQFSGGTIPEMLLIAERYFGIKKINEHGVKHGWFNWPFNFDVIWAEGCNLCIKKEKQNE